MFGIYHHISIKYMQNYINEFTFRMNDNSFDGLLRQCGFSSITSQKR
ncbi:MAG: transposase [Endomicrobium sp.]|nr:transposase [Endomicrobium sp.]